MSNISPRLMAYLKSWFATSTGKQAARGMTVTLTFSDFIGLFQERQIASLEKAIENNSIRYRQSDTNKFAYVLTWKSYAARCSGIFGAGTATICSRMKSKTINLPQKGDTLHEEHRAALSAALTDKPKSEEHRANISAGKKGRRIAGWSEERKAARRALRQAQEAKRKAEKVTASSGFAPVDQPTHRGQQDESQRPAKVRNENQQQNSDHHGWQTDDQEQGERDTPIERFDMCAVARFWDWMPVVASIDRNIVKSNAQSVRLSTLIPH